VKRKQLIEGVATLGDNYYAKLKKIDIFIHNLLNLIFWSALHANESKRTPEAAGEQLSENAASGAGMLFGYCRRK
jgi:hypothetical protein